MLTVVPGDDPGQKGVQDGSSLIDEIVREGARRMLAEALQAEVDAYIAAHAGERDADGRPLVVRNGSHQSREVLTSAGAVQVTVPRVNDKRTDPATGERQRFSSAILPPWARKTPKITEVLPLLYLHGLSTGDFVPALGQFLGSAAGRPGGHAVARVKEGISLPSEPGGGWLPDGSRLTWLNAPSGKKEDRLAVRAAEHNAVLPCGDGEEVSETCTLRPRSARTRPPSPAPGTARPGRCCGPGPRAWSSRKPGPG